MDSLLPLFPLDVVLFPGLPLPLHIFEPRYKEMIGKCLAQSKAFGVVRSVVVADFSARAAWAVRAASHPSRRSRGLGMMSRRQALRGASTPAYLRRGYRGGAIIAASLAMNSTPLITRCLPRPRLTYCKVGARRRARLSPSRSPSAPFRTRRAPFVMHRALHRWSREVGWVQLSQAERPYAHARHLKR